jgi:hypothetical protein
LALVCDTLHTHSSAPAHGCGWRVRVRKCYDLQCQCRARLTHESARSHACPHLTPCTWASVVRGDVCVCASSVRACVRVSTTPYLTHGPSASVRVHRFLTLRHLTHAFTNPSLCVVMLLEASSMLGPHPCATPVVAGITAMCTEWVREKRLWACFDHPTPTYLDQLQLDHHPPSCAFSQCT